LRVATTKVEKYVAALEVVRAANWLSPSMVSNAAPDCKKIMLNIGGLVGLQCLQLFPICL
jgi:hypothetical protein